MAVNILTIPLINVPQRFAVDLAGRALVLNCAWNPEMDSWVLDFIDGLTNEILIGSLPLVTGVDLLSQHEYIGIKGALIAYTDGDSLAVPTLENLGAEANLYYLVDDDA